MQKKNLIRKYLTVGIILLFIGTAVIPSNGQKGENPSLPISSGKTIYVDDDNTEGPWDGTLEHPFLTIQDGVNAANNLDTVYVFSGTYSDTNITKSINLVGELKESTVVNGHLKVLIESVNISKFTIHNPDSGDAGIILNDNKYCNISDNIFNFTGLGGILWADDSIIMNNIYINSNRGIAILAGSNNYIKNNLIISALNGISLESTGGNNIVLNNNVTNCWIGLLVESNDNNIKNNNIYLAHIGINVVFAKKNNINENNFIKNKENAVFTYSPLKLRNNWNHNYWDSLTGIRYKIKGTLRFEDPSIYFKGIPWTNFDWFPAREPYDIPGMR
jgi:parallel beta-helix repeat protein